MHSEDSPLHSRRSPAALTTMLAGWVLLALSVVVGWRMTSRSQDLYDRDSRPLEVAPSKGLGSDEVATIDVFERFRPSVVYIATSELMRGGGLFSYDMVEVPRGSGSGFVWSQDGYVVTNFHVVADSANVYVILADGTKSEGTVVGVDPEHDVAVLKIDAPSHLLVQLQVGRSADLRVGQKVLAIGNPFGLDWTLTSGIISGLERTILSVVGTRIRGVIQTDAAINPGNSGGPLLDSSGRLIGINTAIVSASGASAGIGFAVPVDTVNRIVPQIIRTGHPQRGALGVRILPDLQAQRSGIEGVIVDEVLPGSAAERAGLRSRRGDPRVGQADVIVGIDGEQVSNQLELFELLGEHDPGDRIAVEILRAGERHTVQVVLQEAQVLR